ncbi:MAG TPA: hypothetical protein VGD61_06165 [Pyrinomonadaceae bacterium]
MIMRNVAVVTESDRISFSELTRVSAALQKQAMRDLAPVWDIQATVDAFAELEDVPVGTWPIIIEDDIDVPGASGVHEDSDGQPFSLVTAGPGWSLTASHELVEMLVDPFGRRLTEGQSNKPGQGRVQFLVEPCDPSEAVGFGYVINGVQVSDFYTPKYFSTVFNAADQYSHTGAIKRPRQVLKGGYLSWHDPVTDHWFQETFFSGNKSRFRDLGRLTASAKSFRRQIYDVTNEAFAVRRPKPQQLESLAPALTAAVAPMNSRATQWREQIAAIKAGQG